MGAKIRTTYTGPTADGRGSRIAVAGPHGQRTFPYDYAAYDAHDAAVDDYLQTFNMPGTRLEGPDTADNPRRRLSRSGRGYVYRLQD